MNIIPYSSQNADAITLTVDSCVFARFVVGSPSAVHLDDDRFESGVKS